MNVEIGAEAALFPEKEYISGIFVAVRHGDHPLSWFLLNEQYQHYFLVQVYKLII